MTSRQSVPVIAGSTKQLQLLNSDEMYAVRRRGTDGKWFIYMDDYVKADFDLTRRLVLRIQDGVSHWTLLCSNPVSVHPGRKSSQTYTIGIDLANDCGFDESTDELVAFFEKGHKGSGERHEFYVTYGEIMSGDNTRRSKQTRWIPDGSGDSREVGCQDRYVWNQDVWVNEKETIGRLAAVAKAREAEKFRLANFDFADVLAEVTRPGMRTLSEPAHDFLFKLDPEGWDELGRSRAVPEGLYSERNMATRSRERIEKNFHFGWPKELYFYMYMYERGYKPTLCISDSSDFGRDVIVEMGADRRGRMLNDLSFDVKASSDGVTFLITRYPRKTIAYVFIDAKYNIVGVLGYKVIEDEMDRRGVEVGGKLRFNIGFFEKELYRGVDVFIDAYRNGLR